jgi:hypothetical protein
MDGRYHRGSRHRRATINIGGWKGLRQALLLSYREAVEFYRGYCQLLDVKLSFVIEVQSFGLCGGGDDASN